MIRPSGSCARPCSSSRSSHSSSKGRRSPCARGACSASSPARPPSLGDSTRRWSGRERELQRLRTAFEEAAGQRECRVISVIGTAGIGKSRLVNELLASVDDEASVLVGTLHPVRERHHVLASPRPRPAGSRRAHPGANRRASRRRARRGKDRRPRRGRDRNRRQHERARGDDVGSAPAARAPRPGTAARDRLRRPAVGRAGLPRPDRVPARLDRRRPDSDRLPGPARTARATPRLARLLPERLRDRPRPTVRGRSRGAARAPQR